MSYAILACLASLTLGFLVGKLVGESSMEDYIVDAYDAGWNDARTSVECESCHNEAVDAWEDEH